MMINEDITERLFEYQDLSYRSFHSKLMPEININTIIGVRTPIISKLAKEYSENVEINSFLDALPHRYYDENNLHGFIISQVKDYDESIELLNTFLPYVDNWATCDLLRPKSFKYNKSRRIKDIDKWLSSENTFTVRFGMEMLMVHFLDEDFKKEYLYKVSSVKSEEYYINMMTAWYFATALAKQWDSAVEIIENKELDVWTHNKAIQKALESYRISDAHKQYLKSLRIKKGSI